MVVVHKQNLIDSVLHNQRLNFLNKCEFGDFLSQMAQNSISEEILQAVDWKIDQFLFQRFQKNRNDLWKCSVSTYISL